MDTFHFSCHRRLSCFNSCCRNKHLLLTPYDVIRIKRALHLFSDDFLSQYAVYRLDPGSGFPILSLKMKGAENVCPFVGRDGCEIYDDRPTACRLFPLGRLSALGDDEGGIFYLLDLKGCEGVKENKVQVINQWRIDQGLLPYDEMNDRMLEILFHPKRDRSIFLNEGQQQKVMVACYNVDIFREFVFHTGFLELFRIDAATRKNINKNDEALLQLGFSYLKKVLFP
ncbi:MAG TPA: YkgJ family cysteine cluster protein [Deltaproteobacteria bacterium]|nr:YkgJ family cysteine cluster protein [Deltaproteobacteria bacterium]